MLSFLFVAVKLAKRASFRQKGERAKNERESETIRVVAAASCKKREGRGDQFFLTANKLFMSGTVARAQLYGRTKLYFSFMSHT